MKRITLSLLALLLCCSGLARATDWYIDPVNGSDSNLGTAAAPLKTMMWCLVLAADGDRVFCGPGTYAPSTNGDFVDAATGGAKAWKIGQAQNGIPQRLEIIGAGADVCIANPEVDQSVLSYWCRVYFTAAGTKISGFTFTNPLQMNGRWNTVWRLGSTTTGYTTADVEISHCIFDDVPRAYVSFGESFNISFHDNIVINSGDGVSPTNFGSAGGDLAFIYNNTFMNLARGGIEMLQGAGTGQSSVYIWNNSFFNVANEAIWFDTGFPQPTVHSDYNNFFTVGASYGSGLSAGANDTQVDPLVVSGSDPHLQPSSPLIDAGTDQPSQTIPLPAGFSVYPPYGFDAYLGQRYLDGNSDGQLDIDVGGDEFSNLVVSGQGVYAIGTTAMLTLTDVQGRFTSAPSYVLFAAAAPASIEIPLASFGVVQLDVLSMTVLAGGQFTGGTVTTALPIPNMPSILGTRVPLQYLVAQIVPPNLEGEFAPMVEIAF